MERLDWKELLTSHETWSVLSEDDLEHLLDSSVSKEKSFAKDERILNEGDPGDTVLLVGSGTVRIELTGEAQRNVWVSRFAAGELLGEVGVITRRPRTASVIAEESCVLLEIRGAEFRAER